MTFMSIPLTRKEESNGAVPNNRVSGIKVLSCIAKIAIFESETSGVVSGISNQNPGAGPVAKILIPKSLRGCVVVPTWSTVLFWETTIVVGVLPRLGVQP